MSVGRLCKTTLTELWPLINDCTIFLTAERTQKLKAFLTMTQRIIYNARYKMTKKKRIFFYEFSISKVNSKKSL